MRLFYRLASRKNTLAEIDNLSFTRSLMHHAVGFWQKVYGGIGTIHALPRPISGKTCQLTV
jgi:hypothetical protein